MIENIEIANDADILAKESDFICFGTNDFTESVIKKSRNTSIAQFYILDDEVKDIIKETIYRARAIKPDIEIGFCGEYSNYIENIDFYYEIGASYISCSLIFIDSIKQFLSEINYCKKKNK